MSDIDKGLDWAGVPDPEREAMEVKAKKAKIVVEWKDKDNGEVLAVADGLDHRIVGFLNWDWEHGWFFFRAKDSELVSDGGHLIDVDPEQRIDFHDERSKIVIKAGTQAEYEVLLSELVGRINMHRDETRDLAVMGAKVQAKRWLSLRSGAEVKARIPPWV